MASRIRSRAMVLAAALGTAGVWAGASLLRPAVFPSPVVSVSTLTTRAPDSVAVVIRWTRKCVSTGGRTVCPTSADVLAQTQSPSGVSVLQRRTRSTVSDTVRFLRPLCPDTMTFLGSVATLDTSGVIQQSNRATARMAFRCRVQSAPDVPDERAFLDSFPPANRHITLGSAWGQKIPAPERADALTLQLRGARSRAESTAVRDWWSAVTPMPDSVYSAFRGDTLTFRLGFTYPTCWIGINRYTGVAVLLGGDVLACEVARLAFAGVR